MDLDARMEERRRELGITWAEVGRRAGKMSRQALLDIRNGVADPRSDTRRKIERALQLAPGGFEEMQRGLRPTPATPGEAPRDVPDGLPSREVWISAILDRADQIEAEAGPDAANAYLAGAITRRREEERRILPDQQGSREVS